MYGAMDGYSKNLRTPDVSAEGGLSITRPQNALSQCAQGLLLCDGFFRALQLFVGMIRS